ncbi:MULTISPECIES: hypothetical protein [unclassified Microbacterium]|uniref:hypothetical protein n=1 Tax=unclassified Microbacterium TaxID=2609290 RepID=UPI001604C072|nr:MULTISPECIES: hypothetical protein [unclassified Microbacterium]QNA93254.1 hypothetical protein G4G29_14710 [Microbacterium sp. Se63.02b]QYM63463.1 hypothetical protein K1X59_14760 [Microbacterium sp. Se5.02b]
MDYSGWAALAAGAVSAAVAVFAFVSGARGGTHPSTVQPVTLDQKLDQLRRAAADLRDMAADVTAEAEAQTVIAETAAATAAKNQELASLTEGQAKAVAAILDEGAEGRQRDSKKTTIIWAIVSIVASNIASVFLTLFFSR